MSREDSLGYLLSRAFKLHLQRSHQLMNESGLHPGQTAVMFALWRQDGQVQKDLADKLDLTPATIAVSVQRLEKAGLLKRCKDAHDQRISRVYLTERGRSLHKQVLESIQATNEESLSGFSPSEEELLRQFLLRIIANLKGALRQVD